MVFIVVVSALLVQALCGSATASLLPRPQLRQPGNYVGVPYGPGPILTPEINLPAYYKPELVLPAPKLPAFASEYEIIRSGPSLPVFAQELAFPAPSVSSYVSELSYPRPLPALPSLPMFSSELVIPSRPAILPTPGYPIYDCAKEMIVRGDLPVGGTAAVNGAVPVSGALQFSGYVPAAGSFSVSCGCGNYPSVGIYY